MSHRVAFAVTFVAVCSLSASLLAQPGGRGPGGDRGSYRFDPRDMMRRMDTNQNGMLEQNELSDRARMFVNRAAERAGLDPNQPIPLDKLFSGMDGRRDDNRRDDGRRGEQPKPEGDKVPDFGVQMDLMLVPDFSLPVDSPLLSTVPLEERYDREILERAERVLREYDRNNDGVIDQEEQRRARWSTDPKLSDLNGDGKLNKVELAERYVNRGNRGGNRQDDDRGRDDDRRRDDRSSSSSSRDGEPSGARPQFDTQRYAESLLRQYDSNRNGVLEREEWGRMRSSHHSADRNRDGKITQEELAENFKSQYANRGSSDSRTGSTRTSESSRSSDGGTYRVKTLSERLADLGVSSSSLFVRNDTNSDGQLQMHEFATTWDDSRLTEFYRYDANRDGVITPQEWLTGEN